jgi:hypothetical protein
MLAVAGALDKSGIAQGAAQLSASTALISGALVLLTALALSLHRLRHFEFREKP